MKRPLLVGPLKGVKILDLSRLLPGPLATQLMADMGAEVIKLEDPKAIDYARNMAPHYQDIGLIYLALNHSKKSLSIDLSTEKGKKIFWEVLKTVDIVIDSFRPGVLEKIGIDFETAKRYKSDIIYVSVTGYGHENYLSQKAGHDINYLGHAGVLSTNGNKAEMVQTGVQLADIAGGSYPTVIACLSAIIARNTTGEAQFVDVAMVDGSMPFMTLYLAEVMNTGRKYERQQHVLSGSIPNYHIYECKDNKWIALGALEPKFWMGFCEWIGKPEWSSKMFDTSFIPEMKKLFLTQNRDYWVAEAQSADICLTAILEMDELTSDRYLQERNLFVEHEHPHYGKIKSLQQPIKFKNVPVQEGWAPPLLGEDNETILQALGYTEDEIEQLSSHKILYKK